MAQEKIFADGMHFESPGEKAPAWVKGKISIKVDSFISFLEKYKNEKGWINLDLKQSQKGGLYVELNQWKKGNNQKDNGNFEVPAKEEDPFS